VLGLLIIIIIAIEGSTFTMERTFDANFTIPIVFNHSAECLPTMTALFVVHADTTPPIAFGVPLPSDSDEIEKARSLFCIQIHGDMLYECRVQRVVLC
tara:strand:- start:350 stop:643 length:294 start_codon:yes stop_codon:yes gene_type:complete